VTRTARTLRRMVNVSIRCEAAGLPVLARGLHVSRMLAYAHNRERLDVLGALHEAMARGDEHAVLALAETHTPFPRRKA
jgi:hypothetical protein